MSTPTAHRASPAELRAPPAGHRASPAEDRHPGPGESGQACFALLDDCTATAQRPVSRLYTGYAGTLACERAGQLGESFDAMDRALRAGLHAVGLFSYELGAALHGMPPSGELEAAPHGMPPAGCVPPLARILLFERLERLSEEQVRAWLAARAAAGPAGISGLRADVDEARYRADVARIRAYIAQGDTYQVNYTFRLGFRAHGGPHALYARLRARQPVPYGALLGLPGGGAVLSLSPELFMRHREGELIARPMKGTAAAGPEGPERVARARALGGDAKNRAENVMIVDLLRNDIGRIAVTGSVAVPSLFDVEAFGSVLQMTSTIRGTLRPGTGHGELFEALYPCGSITGAPKRRTMEIIRELERSPRGLYTGAIGWFEPPADGRRRIGEFCLSIPIRTLELDPPDPDGAREGRMGIGSGIVHDSDAGLEFQECWLKASFLSGIALDGADGHPLRDAPARPDAVEVG